MNMNRFQVAALGMVGILIVGCSALPPIPKDKELVMTFKLGGECREGMQEIDSAEITKYFGFSSNRVTTCATAVDTNETIAIK